MGKNRQYQLKCPHCGHEFTDYFDVLGYNYTTNACCPKCGDFVRVKIDAQGNKVEADMEV